MPKCKAVFYIGDDFGDNEATMHCDLEEGHDGWHVENGRGRKYTFSWEVDERHVCSKCKNRMEEANFCRFCGKDFCCECMPETDEVRQSCDECKPKPKCEKHNGRYLMPCWVCKSKEEQKT